MANTSSIRVLENGQKNYTIQLTGFLDTSNQAQTTLIDTTAAAFQNSLNSGNFGPAFTLKLDEASYSITPPLTLRFYWDATTPLIIATYTGYNDSSKYMSPIENDAGVGKTGKVLWDSVGWTAGVIPFSIYMSWFKAYR